MDVIRVFQVVLRRWKLVLPILVLGLGITAVVATQIPDEYTTEGSVIVVDSAAAATGISTAVIAEAVQDSAIRTQVAQAAGSGRYTVTAADGGILRVTAPASTAELASTTVNAVLDQLQPVVAARAQAAGQAGPAPTIEILNRPTPDSAEAQDEVLVASGSARLVTGEATLLSGERASRLLAQAVSSGAVRAEVVAAGGVADYTVTTSKNLPTLSISATGTDRDAVASTVALVVARAGAELDRLAEVAGQRAGAVAVQPLGEPGGVAVDTTGVFRSVLALIALTGGIAIAAAFLAESLAERRRSEGSRESAPKPRRAVRPAKRPAPAPKERDGAVPARPGPTVPPLPARTEGGQAVPARPPRTAPPIPAREDDGAAVPARPVGTALPAPARKEDDGAAPARRLRARPEASERRPVAPARPDATTRRP